MQKVLAISRDRYMAGKLEEFGEFILGYKHCRTYVRVIGSRCVGIFAYETSSMRP